MTSPTKRTAPFLSLPDQIVAYVQEGHCVVLYTSQKVVGVYHNCKPEERKQAGIRLVDMQKIPPFHGLETLSSYLRAANCSICTCPLKDCRKI